MPGVTALHHVALISRDLPRTADFYERVLGLRDLGMGAVPLTSQQHTREIAEAPARFFTDPSGSGMLLAVVHQPDTPQGAPGIGGTHHFALCVADREELLKWKRRALDEGYAVNGILDRHYFQSIYVADPDGTIVELATRGPGWTRDEPAGHIGEVHCVPPPEMVNTNRDRARVAAENWPAPIHDISDRMRIQGMHHVTAIGTSIERTHEFVSGQLGMHRVKRTSNFDDIGSFHWYWGVGDGAPGTVLTYFERSPAREKPVRMGSGQVAHYAVATAPDAIEEMHVAIKVSGLPVSRLGEFGPDGARFRALATQDPDGQPVLVASNDRREDESR